MVVGGAWHGGGVVYYGLEEGADVVFCCCEVLWVEVRGDEGGPFVWGESYGDGDDGVVVEWGWVGMGGGVVCHECFDVGEFGGGNFAGGCKPAINCRFGYVTLIGEPLAFFAGAFQPSFYLLRRIHGILLAFLIIRIKQKKIFLSLLRKYFLHNICVSDKSTVVMSTHIINNDKLYIKVPALVYGELAIRAALAGVDLSGYIVQAALAKRGLPCGRGEASREAHVSVGTATAGGVMVPCSGGGDAVLPVLVDSGDGLDLNLR